MKLGENIKQARKAKRLSLRDAARLSFIHETTLSKIEANKSKWYPKEPALKPLAQVLDLDPDDLTLKTGRIPDRFKALVEEKSDEVLAFLKQLETDRQC